MFLPSEMSAFTSPETSATMGFSFAASASVSSSVFWKSIVSAWK
jgi:hypothetical protein